MTTSTSRSVLVRGVLAMLAAFNCVAAAVPVAQAQGFASKDLEALKPVMVQALGTGFVGRVRDTQADFVCTGCAGMPMVRIEFGRQTDGTEQRVRSGATGIADLDTQCRAREPACRITALSVAPAIGWVSAWPMAGSSAATAVILQDGDKAVIRAVATDPATARRMVDQVVTVVRARVIGG